MKNFHLVMPMGGKGQRFFNDGYVAPKPLIEIHDRPFFYWSTMSILKYNPDCDVTFVVLREHIEKFDIKNRILSYFPQARVEVIPEVLAGAVLTCMAGVENINDDRPVLFNDCDHMFCCSEFNSMDGKVRQSMTACCSRSNQICRSSAMLCVMKMVLLLELRRKLLLVTMQYAEHIISEIRTFFLKTPRDICRSANIVNIL